MLAKPLSPATWIFAATLLAGPIFSFAGVDPLACTCGFRACNAILEADAVFEATVASIEKIPASFDARRGERPERYDPVAYPHLSVALEYLRPWRGDTPQIVLTAQGEAACGFEFRVGSRYLIQARRLDSGEYWVSFCGDTLPIERSWPRIEYLRAVEASAPDETFVFGVADEFINRSSYIRRDWAQALAPIPQTRVAISGAAQAEAETDIDGRFSISGLPHGTYTARWTLPPTRADLTLAHPVQEFVLEGAHACAVIGVQTGTR